MHWNCVSFRFGLSVEKINKPGLVVVEIMCSAHIYSATKSRKALFVCLQITSVALSPTLGDHRLRHDDECATLNLISTYHPLLKTNLSKHK